MGPAENQVTNITPPIAGQFAVLACSATAGVVDLQSVGQQSPAVDVTDIGAVNKYVRIFPDGGQVYVNFGPTLASVTGANAPNPATQTAVNGSGVVTLAAGVAFPIASGGFVDVRPTKNGSRFMGFVVKSGVTANLVVAVASQ